VETLLPMLAKEDIARTSWENNGAIIIARNEKELLTVTNQIAAEHLEVMTKDPEALLPYIHNAGAIFLGHYTPEAIGDYMAGPSHVLPTAGTAAFSSGLSVYDFLKRMSLIACTKASFAKLAEPTAHLADQERLGAHALSTRIRMEKG
jgi:histidinol dehydrogenase